MKAGNAVFPCPQCGILLFTGFELAPDPPTSQSVAQCHCGYDVAFVAKRVVEAEGRFLGRMVVSMVEAG